MKPAARWAFFTLVVVAASGLAMRAFPWLPLPGIQFEALRHAHSHLAFLGWVYSAFYLALVRFFLPEGSFATPRYRQLFWLAQVAAVGMFAAFLRQGYGAVSIALLTLHTLLAYAFFFFFIKDWKREKRQPSTWFALVAIGAFLLSSLGPFAIPVVQVVGGGSPFWMRMAVHFYLHFQYNGWFVFGLMAVFFKILENSGALFPPALARLQWWLMAISLLPAYFLYAPAAGRIGTASPVLLATAWAQWLGVSIFVFQFAQSKWAKGMGGDAVQRFLLRFSVGCLFLKSSFELLAILPMPTPVFERGNHFLTLGYLHLLFLGGVTPFVWWLAAREGWAGAKKPAALAGTLLFAAGFVGSEACLFAMGVKWGMPWFSQMMLGFTTLMAGGIVLFFSTFFQQPPHSCLKTLAK